MIKNQLKAILIGAGDRGMNTYGLYAINNPDDLNFIAVAEPDPNRRSSFSEAHKIPEDYQFSDWKEILEKPKFADIAFIATQDQMHEGPAVKAMELGYHVLLEKPLATTEEACKNIVETSERENVVLMIAHELRYAEFFIKIKDILDSGKIGEIITINHYLNFHFWAYAHGFVRGNWNNRDETTPMILAKACHDFDLICWYAGVKPIKVSSFARGPYLSPKQRPEGAPDRCTDGCPHADTCQYNAISIYLNFIQPRRELIFSGNKMLSYFVRLSINHQNILRLLFPPARKHLPYRGWPISVLTDDLTDEGIMKALKEGPYGRCVYACNNNQVAAQVNNIEFENGIVASLTMHGHSTKNNRRIRIDGTKGSIVGNFSEGEMQITVYDQVEGTYEPIPFKFKVELHGGGDILLLNTLIAAVRGETQSYTMARESVQSHLISLAADRSAREGKIIEIKQK